MKNIAKRWTSKWDVRFKVCEQFRMEQSYKGNKFEIVNKCFGESTKAESLKALLLNTVQGNLKYGPILV